MQIAIIGTHNDKACFDKLQAINQTKALNLALSWHALDKLTDKTIRQFKSSMSDPHIIAIIKHTPILLTINHNTLIKTSLNWQSLTHRIVNAGRKSELLLQACKLTAQMTVVDGMAGFGHDGLILASTGAKTTMIEKNPIMALLLFFEYDMMMSHQNWQKLLGRIQILHGAFESIIGTLDKPNVVYLDPMFPNDSYHAKVGKTMQTLHQLVNPPTFEEEMTLLTVAHASLSQLGRVVIKRPLSAPHLANKLPNQSIANDAIRFDKYDQQEQFTI